MGEGKREKREEGKKEGDRKNGEGDLHGGNSEIVVYKAEKHFYSVSYFPCLLTPHASFVCCAYSPAHG